MLCLRIFLVVVVGLTGAYNAEAAVSTGGEDIEGAMKNARGSSSGRRGGVSSISASISARTGGASGPPGNLRAAWSASPRVDMPFPMLHVHFCLGCEYPAAEGSLVMALAPYHGIRDFMVSGDLVQAVPNKGNAEDLLNADDMAAGIIVFERGEVPMVEKVLKAQAAGATGAIIIDDGGCGDDLDDCGRLGGARDGGFAKRDGAHAWSSVKIPAVLVSEGDGQRLRGMMRLQQVAIEGLGDQLVER